MIPPVTTTAISPKPITSQTPPTANRTLTPSGPDTARASVGEVAAGNVRAETARAVDAPEQSAVAPRLRDRETTEASQRLAREADAPTGPPPSFEESPLERQKRTAFEPPDIRPKPDSAQQEPPGRAREQAEIGFAGTRALAEPREPPEVDLSAGRRAAPEPDDPGQIPPR